MPGIDLPVMILHGEKDPIVNVSYSQRAEKVFPHAELTVFPGEGHGFTAESNRKMDEMITAFVRKYLS
jgi:pimeloyl-ACP methyl ester carboxylesterase